MSNGANFVHKQLRLELEDYIKSQYFGKSPLLLSAISDQLDKEGVLYRKPYIESSPAYKSKKNGIQTSDIPVWLKEYFTKLSAAGVGGGGLRLLAAGQRPGRGGLFPRGGERGALFRGRYRL